MRGFNSSELLLVHIFQYVLIGNLSWKKYVAPIDVEALHVVILQLDSGRSIVEVEKSFACSTEAICLPLRNRLSCCAFCSSMHTRLLKSAVSNFLRALATFESSSLIRPALLRIAMAHPAVASSLISGLGLSIPLPDPFALTSTLGCWKTRPRSRTTETQPIPAAAALTAA